MLFLGLGPQKEFDEESVCESLPSFTNPKHLPEEGESRDSFLELISIFTSTVSFLFTTLGRFANEGELMLHDL